MLEIVHMSGAGNNFLVADGRDMVTPLPPGAVRSYIELFPRLDGRAIEGFLVLRSVEQRRITADFYNPDGSNGMMCGNGARCIVRFACDRTALADDDLTLELNGNTYGARYHADSSVTIQFPPPTDERHYPIGSLTEVEVDTHYVNVNSDHVVIDGPCDAQRTVVTVLRNHPTFPRGTNVNMVDVLGPASIRMATYERGVEAITGACGTGAISACIVMWRLGRCADVVTVEPPSKRLLVVTLFHDGSTLTACTLRGDAQYDNS